MNKNTCPRCLGSIPNNDQPGAYPGALSRLTRGEHDEPVEVCSRCGEDEGLGVIGLGRGLVPMHLWPIQTDTTPPEALEGKVTVTLIRPPDPEWVKRMERVVTHNRR